MKVRIEAESEDPHLRFHGLSVDEPLNRDFWNTQQQKIIATQGSPFSWESEVVETARTVTYGNSGYALPGAPAGPWPWHTKMFVNDVLAAEGDVGRDQHLTVTLEEGVPAPAPVNWGWWLFMLGLGVIGVVALGGYITYREITK